MRQDEGKKRKFDRKSPGRKGGKTLPKESQEDKAGSLHSVKKKGGKVAGDREKRGGGLPGRDMTSCTLKRTPLGRGTSKNLHLLVAGKADWQSDGGEKGGIQEGGGGVKKGGGKHTWLLPKKDLRKRKGALKKLARKNSPNCSGSEGRAEEKKR